MNTDNCDLIDTVLDEMAPLSKPTVSTPTTVMTIRTIIREALLKYEAKLQSHNKQMDTKDDVEAAADARRQKSRKESMGQTQGWIDVIKNGKQ